MYYIKSSSHRINSPISAWLKHTTDSGSVCLHSVVLFAATPKPWNKFNISKMIYSKKVMFYFLWQYHIIFFVFSK